MALDGADRHACRSHAGRLFLWTGERRIGRWHRRCWDNPRRQFAGRRRFLRTFPLEGSNRHRSSAISEARRPLAQPCRRTEQSWLGTATSETSTSKHSAGPHRPAWWPWHCFELSKQSGLRYVGERHRRRRHHRCVFRGGSCVRWTEQDGMVSLGDFPGGRSKAPRARFQPTGRSSSASVMTAILSASSATCRCSSGTRCTGCVRSATCCSSRGST